MEFKEGLSIEIKGEELILLPQKAIYWPKEKTLLIADLHLGKGNHFRKNGISIPSTAHQKNWGRLDDLASIQHLEKIIFLGDLFHSSFNDECLQLQEFILERPSIQFELVQGNHDILNDENYLQMDLHIHPQAIELGPFLLSHEPIIEDGKYNIAGHIHPGVKLRGRGRQSQRIACFQFGKNSALMPAFGDLTGLHAVNVKKSDQIFLIVDEQIIPAQ